tara:strand:- start:5027 stop:6808 length:1782 start_codon:yes stop_codon:yes gene_type:complete
MLTSFGVHQPDDMDIFFYYNAGNEILHGDGSNVFIANAGIGWPVTLAFFTDYVGDVFTTAKSIALISSVLIIFITFFLLKNILGSTSSALIGQAFLAINPFIQLDAIITNNELLPLLFIFLSAYILSKKDSTKKYVLIGLFLGISFWFRYQSLLILFGIIIYFLLSNQIIRVTAKKTIITSLVFLLIISPMLLYNYSEQGVFIDIDPSLYLNVYGSESDKEMWGDSFVEKVSSDTRKNSWIEKIVFNEQYVNNLFKINPHTIFNLNSGINNFSPIPIIQFSGIPIFLLASLYLFNLRRTRFEFILPVSVFVISASILIFYNKIEDYYFALFILPVISLGLISIRRIESRILPFLIIPVVFYMGLSLVPIYDPLNMFAVLISLPLLTVIFCMRFIPFLVKKIKIQPIIKKSNFIIFVFILIIIISNVGFSYKLESMVMYKDYEIGSINDEIQKFFDRKESQINDDMKQISLLLSTEPNISEKYIMSNTYSLAHRTESKNVYANFVEDVNSKSVEQFLLRDSWSAFDVNYSNHYSVPPDRKDLNHPIPDYLVYIHRNYVEVPWIIKELNENPEKFEKIYQSKQTESVAFKIKDMN